MLDNLDILPLYYNIMCQAKLSIQIHNHFLHQCESTVYQWIEFVIPKPAEANGKEFMSVVLPKILLLNLYRCKHVPVWILVADNICVMIPDSKSAFIMFAVLFFPYNKRS